MPNQLPIVIEREGNVLMVSLNNPEKRNALNSEMMGAAASAISQVGDYKELRAIVIRGKGSSFCSGADLKEFKNNNSIFIDIDKYFQKKGVNDINIFIFGWC